MSAKRLGIGIIGTGNISSAYLKAILGREGLAGFPVLDIKGLADMRAETAQARASEFGLKAMSVEEMLADPEIKLIINLTIPRAHVDVGLRCLAAGKHVYSEKPLGITYAEGRKLLDAANAAACASARRRTRSSVARTSRRGPWWTVAHWARSWAARLLPVPRP